MNRTLSARALILGLGSAAAIGFGALPAAAGVSSDPAPPALTTTTGLSADAGLSAGVGLSADAGLSAGVGLSANGALSADAGLSALVAAKTMPTTAVIKLLPADLATAVEADSQDGALQNRTAGELIAELPQALAVKVGLALAAHLGLTAGAGVDASGAATVAAN